MGDCAWLLLAEIDPVSGPDPADGQGGASAGLAAAALQAVAADAALDHGGGVVHVASHAVLAGFRSADDAVAAALGLQAGLVARRHVGGPAVLARIAVDADAGSGGGRNDGDGLPDRLAALVATAHGGQIVATGAVERAVTVPGRLAGIGSYWIVGHDGPIGMFQAVDARGGPTAFPPLRGAVPATGGALAPDLTSFRGRDGELEELSALLGSARLVTLVGAGGAGKSRLAREAVRRLPGTGAGPRLVELATVRDPIAVPGAVAAALGLDLDESPQRDQLVDRLRTSSMVLVLDNCEHLVEAVGPLVTALAGGCPHLRILATSRQPLAVAGEHQLRVLPLALGDATRLFLDRAAAHGWRPSGPADEQAVAELCRALDRLPLAIEITAGWTATMTAAELVVASRDRAGLLDRSDPAAGADDRHRSLRAVLARSYELLGPAEREALDDLSVMGGRFDLAAATAVLGGDDDPGAGPGTEGAALVVRSLVERSLVGVERHGDRTLFQLHETVRAFAGQRLDHSGGRRRQLERLGAFLGRALADRPDDDAWLEEADSRYGLLTTAIGDLVAVDPSTAGRLALVVSRYLRIRQQLGTGIEQLVAWASALPTSGESRRLAGQLVYDLTLLARVAEGDQWCRRHAEMTAELGYPSVEHPQVLLEGTVELVRGNLAAAADLLGRALEAASPRCPSGDGAPNRYVRMCAAWNLTCVQGALGRFEEAEANVMLALGLAVELGELNAARTLAANAVDVQSVRTGPAVQAANILRWYDDSRIDMDRSCPRASHVTALVAIELGRFGDAARLIRLVMESPSGGSIYNDGERPEDLLALVAAADPEACDAARVAPLLSPAEALDLIGDVLTDPALPPQAELIDPYAVAAARRAAEGTEPAAADGAGSRAAVGSGRAGGATAIGRLAPAAADVLVRGGDRRRYQRGEILFRQGQPATAVHLVLSGWVAHQSTSPEGEIATLDVAGPGDLVGELSLLHPGEPRPTSAVGLGPVETVVYRPAELDALGREHPAVQRVVVEHLLGQVRRLTGSLTDALNLPAEKRVLRRLADLCSIYSAGARPIPPVTVPLTQDEMATMAGTSRPTVNRVLRQAEDEGYLRLGRGRVLVDDVGALGRAADLDAGYWMPWSSA